MDAINILKRFESFLNKVELATMKLANGTVLEADAFEEGKSVFIVTEDERVPLPVGEYEMEDGRVLVVGEVGKIGKIGLETIPEAEEEGYKDGIADAKEDIKEDVDKTKLETVPEAEEEGYKDGIADGKEDIKEDIEDTNLEYVSKEEFESKVNEIKEMISKVEAKLNEGKKEDDAFVVKEELEKTNLFKHNPNADVETKRHFKLGANAPMSTMDKIMERISNIKN